MTPTRSRSLLDPVSPASSSELSPEAKQMMADARSRKFKSRQMHFAREKRSSKLASWIGNDSSTSCDVSLSVYENQLGTNRHEINVVILLYDIEDVILLPKFCFRILLCVIHLLCHSFCPWINRRPNSLCYLYLFATVLYLCPYVHTS